MPYMLSGGGRVLGDRPRESVVVTGDQNGSVVCLRLPLKRASAHLLRRSLARHLAQNDVPRPAAADVLLAADEAYVNAFMHSGDVGGEVDVRAEVRAGRVLLEISDGGCGFELGAVDVQSRPDPFNAHGRGLFLIHHLMDDVNVRAGGAGGHGTCVRMVKDFRPRPSTAASVTT